MTSLLAALGVSLLLTIAQPALATDHAHEQAKNHAHDQTDEHTESALQRAAKTTSEHKASPEAVPTETLDDSHGPQIVTPKVKSTAAPGMASKTRGHAKADDHHGGGGTDATTSLRWLKNGNIRYLKKHFRKDGRDASDRARLSKGQKPHAIVLSCADSRVPPEIVFDQALGEIFAIRVAGEALDSSVIASIEYAVEHLGTKLLVVMGHSQCGAVKAALDTKEGESAGSTDLDQLVADIRPRLKTVIKDEPSKNLEVESAVNADGVARDLVKRSEILRKKVESGDLQIKTALYRIETGKVSFY